MEGTLDLAPSETAIHHWDLTGVWEDYLEAMVVLLETMILDNRIIRNTIHKETQGRRSLKNGLR